MDSIMKDDGYGDGYGDVKETMNIKKSRAYTVGNEAGD